MSGYKLVCHSYTLFVDTELLRLTYGLVKKPEIFLSNGYNRERHMNETTTLDYQLLAMNFALV
jgi:hypothetical protein